VIRVLLVDDHASARQPLAILLDREPDIAVVAQAGSLAEARARLAEAEVAVDVAVVDLGLPDGDGVELVRDLRATNPEGAVMVLTSSVDRRHHARAVEAGASGVLAKSAQLAEIIGAIRRLCEGEPLLPPREAIDLLRLAGRERDQQHAAQAALARLTGREREVLQALADGLSDKEIAERLNVSAKTVRAHMVNLLGKLGVDSRLQALVFAVRHGVVTIA
jgi:DNA-binding NarL/FixJ family response regulator